jgi:hypothetical protein
VRIQLPDSFCPIRLSQGTCHPSWHRTKLSFPGRNLPHCSQHFLLTITCNQRSEDMPRNGVRTVLWGRRGASTREAMDEAAQANLRVREYATEAPLPTPTPQNASHTQWPHAGFRSSSIRNAESCGKPHCGSCATWKRLPLIKLVLLNTAKKVRKCIGSRTY